MPIEPFSSILSRHGLDLRRKSAEVLQINVGSLCNQECRHCHLEAGPVSTEIMDAETVREVIAYARRGGFRVADITGGAVEMTPHLDRLIVGLSTVVPRLMLRSNLTAIDSYGRDVLAGLCREHRVAIVASFPSVSEAQTDSQRGKGVWGQSISVLRRLNAMGYGQPGSGLELDLVSNPTGAFLPPSQAQAEKRFRSDLQRKWGIVFSRLFTFANAPLGRFRRWLADSGNLDAYLGRLASAFNPCTVEGLMCRTLVSVSWEGYLFDCDFNLSCGLPLGGRKLHVSEMPGPPEAGSPIAVSDHCYACTAGAGFT